MKTEFLKARFGRTPQIVGIVLLSGGLFSASIFAFLTPMINFLISLNEVIPNATDAQNMSPETLEKLGLNQPGNQASVIDIMSSSGMGMSLPAIGIAVLGALLVTYEYRYGSIARTALHQPRRTALFLHKWAALSAWVGIITVALIVLQSLTLMAGLALQGEALRIDATTAVALWGRGALALQAYAALGLGVGFLVRSQIPTLMLLIGMLTVESIVRPLMSMMLSGVNPTSFLPFGLASDAVRGGLGQAFMPTQPALSIPAALVTLAIWAALALGAGLLSFHREDLAFGPA